MYRRGKITLYLSSFVPNTSFFFYVPFYKSVDLYVISCNNSFLKFYHLFYAYFYEILLLCDDTLNFMFLYFPYVFLLFESLRITFYSLVPGAPLLSLWTMIYTLCLRVVFVKLLRHGPEKFKDYCLNETLMS